MSESPSGCSNGCILVVVDNNIDPEDLAANDLDLPITLYDGIEDLVHQLRHLVAVPGREVRGLRPLQGFP